MARVDDIDELRRQLGECLYVVQSFYSNTNWVEMFGGVAYANFGKKKERIYIIREIDAINQKQEKNKNKNKQTNKKGEQITKTNPKAKEQFHKKKKKNTTKSKNKNH